MQSHSHRSQFISIFMTDVARTVFKFSAYALPDSKTDEDRKIMLYIPIQLNFTPL